MLHVDKITRLYHENVSIFIKLLVISIAKRKKIFLIEDAAESIGAKINNRMVGTFGDMSIFSFAGNKVLTTGEGGCVVTNSKKYFSKLFLQIVKEFFFILHFQFFQFPTTTNS